MLPMVLVSYTFFGTGCRSPQLRSDSMIEMNPGYAHESRVGPVFDVTSWSASKSLWMSLMGLIFAVQALGAAVFLWNPRIMDGKMPPGTQHVISDVIEVHRTHAWPIRGGIALAGGLGWVFSAASIAFFRDGCCGNYYFRAGPGGLSLRMPQGLSWQHGGFVSAVLELDLPWDEIKRLTVTQTKQIGSLSRNSGNVGAEMKIVTHLGKTHQIDLGGLEAAAYLIHERLIDSQEMMPANLGATLPQDTAV